MDTKLAYDKQRVLDHKQNSNGFINLPPHLKADQQKLDALARFLNTVLYGFTQDVLTTYSTSMSRQEWLVISNADLTFQPALSASQSINLYDILAHV